MAYFLKLSKFFLFLTALTPLVVGNNIFPFVFDKLIFFRSLVEISLILLLIYTAYQLYYGNFSAISSKLKELIKNSLTIFIFLFLASTLLSSLLAVNPYRAFWGDLERGEGFFALLHYVIFFLIAFLVFHRKDWLRFFKISLIVSLILIVFAFLQLPIFGIEKLPLNLDINNRPGSLLGNPSFLASYMIFTILFAIIVIKQSIFSEKNLFNKLWFWFGCLMIPLAIFTILITGTRGALLGLAAGVFAMLIYFSVYGNVISFNVIKFTRLNFRKLSIFLLAVIIIFSSIFWLTRDNFFWQKIPGLNRLAQTKLLDANDSSTMVRFITWKLSWEAFKGRLLFGWGPDNYLIAFEKYYNPDLALYGEGLWIDRAHNKIIDIAVMQGVLGLAAYLGIFASFFYLLFKKYNNYIAPFFVAGIIAYFIQNLFLFDHTSSYLALFAFLGFFISSRNNFDNKESVFVNQSLSYKYKLILFFVISAIFIVFTYSLYFYNYIPHRQARDFWKSTENTDINVLLNQLERATNPYNFAQYNIRGKGIDLIYLGQYFENEKYMSNPKFDKLGDFLIKIMDDFIAREPYDIRLLMKQVEALNAVARQHPEKNEALYRKAEVILIKVMAISPQRQEAYYHLAFNLANQKRFNESIAIAHSAVDLSPKVARAHYHFGFMLFLAGDNEATLKEFEIVEELDPRFLTLLIGDINNILLIYEKLGKFDKVSEIAKMAAEDNKNDIQPAFYLSALKYYAKNHEQQNFIKIASYLAKSPHLKDAMDIFIKLAEKNLWDEIEKYQ